MFVYCVSNILFHNDCVLSFVPSILLHLCVWGRVTHLHQRNVSRFVSQSVLCLTATDNSWLPVEPWPWQITQKSILARQGALQLITSVLGLLYPQHIPYKNPLLMSANEIAHEECGRPSVIIFLVISATHATFNA